MQSKTQAKKTFILILYGYPGSGKSTFARQLAAEIKDTVHLDIDKVRSELGTELKKRNAENESIYNVLVEYIAREFISNGFNIILDIPMYKRSERRKVQAMARTLNAQLVMAWLQIDSGSAFERLRKRDKRKVNDRYARNYTRSEFDGVIGMIQNPADEDYVVISGKHTFNTQRLAVFKKFQELGIIGVEYGSVKKIKPELVNLIPQSYRGRDGLRRRDISIR